MGNSDSEDTPDGTAQEKTVKKKKEKEKFPNKGTPSISLSTIPV
jgi:hypothetical protein